MGLGLANAIGELALVVFTTLAPAAAIGYALSSVSIMTAALGDEQRGKFLQRLFIPLLVCMIGLIASAAHLGNPANVLYVLTGIGRSPLSNEVASAVVFLALAGTFWLYSFSLKPNVTLQRVWSTLTCIAAFIFVTLASFAYDVETIITWNSACTPVSIWCNALAAGPLVAILTLKLNPKDNKKPRQRKLLIAVFAFAAAAGAVTYFVQGLNLSEMGNYIATTKELFSCYWIAFALYIALCATAFLLRRHLTASTVLMFAAIFIMRFSFYTLHMTAGLGI